jgi:hypothetical protein
MVLQKKYTFDESLYPPVLARPDGLRSPRSRTIDPAYLASSVGADGITQRILPPGTFAATIAGSNKLRPLPRTKLTAAITTSSTELSVTPNTGRFFVENEGILVLAPYARADFASTWANADTATLTIGGQSVVFTNAAGTTLANIATAAAAAFNAAEAFKGRVTIVAEAQYLHIYANDFSTLYSISAAESTVGTGTFALNGSVTTLQAATTVGTVDSVDAATDTITLASGAGVRLPAGMPIGAANASPADSNGKGWGMISPNQPADLEWAANTDHGLFISGTVYEDRLPYWDGELMRLFPEIVFD